MPQMQNKLNPNAFNKQQFPYGTPNSIAPNFMTGRNPNQSQHTTNNMPPRNPPNAGKPNVNNGHNNCHPNANNQSTTTLQMKQTQQLHINQHGPNSPGIHVSAGQHMHLSSDMKNNVSVAAQQGIFFNQQHQNKGQQPQNMNPGPTCNTNPSNMNNSQQSHVPQPNNNPQNVANDSYSVSQTQTINFTQQTLRQRQAQPPSNQQAPPSQAQQQSQLGMQMNMSQQNQVNLPQSMAQNAGSGAGNPIQNMTAMSNPMGMNMNAHGAMLQTTTVMQQRQHMMRAQAMQMGNRPPPPEYKGMLPNQMMHQAGRGFPNNAAAPNMRRMNQQHMPNTGAVMRPQHQMYMQQHANAPQRMPTQFGHMNQRQPNVQVTPDKMAMNQDWRHTTIMSQQQTINFNDNGNSLEFLDNLPVTDPSNYSDILNSLDNENFNFPDMLQ